MQIVFNLFTAPPPTSNANNDNPSIGMPQQNLAPPPPNSMFGDTIVASNPFDDTPIQHSHQNGGKSLQFLRFRKVAFDAYVEFEYYLQV